MGKRLLIVVVLLILAMVGIIVNGTLRAAGAYRDLVYRYDGTCTPISGVVGAEDLQIDHATGLAYISGDDRLASLAGNPVRGQIAVMNMADELPQPVDITPASMPDDFHPHGLSLYRDAMAGQLTLMVINHKEDGSHTVEVFDVTEPADGALPRLTHRTTMAHEVMNSPNDLVAVGPDAFYFSNDSGSETALGRQLEGFLRLPRASFGYVDQNGGRLVDEGIRMGNGINISADGKTLYGAALLDRTIRIYDRDLETNDIELRDIVAVNTLPDNIDVAEDGSLWVGAHPKIFEFLGYMGGSNDKAPSEVLRFAFNEKGNGGTVDQIYLQDGTEASASSVAAAYQGRFVIGTVADDDMLVCTDPTGMKALAAQ